MTDPEPSRRRAVVPGPARGPLDEPGPRLVAERLLTWAREEVARADTKASVLLSGVVAVSVLVVSAGRGPGGSGPVGAVGTGLWCAGIMMLTMVILPRTRPPGRPWRGPRATDAGRGPSVATLHAEAGPEELATAVLAAGGDPARWMLDQARVLGAILAVKYRWMRWAVAFLAAGAAVAATAR
ncbi:Pycsar system effector family protein [Streptomyces phaeofaciens]|uniref:Pycsar system effector family protein n=1 Tax=Streptomyces phaeofaciens TaxID=68254 RepID=UPI00367E8E06